MICESCGALVQEESGLVSEQGFGETESGRIVATGVQIGQDQTHQRSYQTGGAHGHVGRDHMPNRDRTTNQARNIMSSYIPILGIEESDVNRGVNIFGLAYTLGFLRGRTIEAVSVASLYISCRRRKEQVQGVQRPVYGLMLIDFAERINMDVFALGKIYRDLYEKLWFDKGSHTWTNEGASADYQGMDPAVLVPNFVKQLDFDKQHEPKIRYDAIQILKRMKRDWIHHGRRPSGVCAAAILLAARMNNYRRTTREIVLIAKVTEITINKRLEEFHDTQGSNLSVQRFMEEAKVVDKLSDQDSHWLDEKLPPVVKQQQNPKPKRKPGRPRKRPLPETAAEIEGDTGTPGPQSATDAIEAQPSPAKRVRIDAEGYKIPEIPTRLPGGRVSYDFGGPSSSPRVEDQSSENVFSKQTSPTEETVDKSDTSQDAESTSEDDSDEDEEGSSKQDGAEAERETSQAPTKKRTRWKAPPASMAEIAMETDIQAAMDETMADNPDLSADYVPSTENSQAPAVPPSPPATNTTSSQQPAQPTQPNPQGQPSQPIVDPTQTVPPHRKDKSNGPACNTSLGNLGHVSLSPTIRPEEFDSDEDVSSCTLTEEESRIKERVWVSMNADWLRQDHAKRIKRELKEAEMRAKGLDPAEEERKKKAAKGKRKDGTKRPGRRGDVSYLKENREGGRKKRKDDTAEGEVDEGGEEDEEEDDGADAGERSAARSVREMLIARGTFSRRINYDALEAIYGSTSSAASEEGADSPGSSRTSTPQLTASDIFRGNRGRDRRSTLPAERRERERRARNEEKKLAKAAAQARTSRSASGSQTQDEEEDDDDDEANEEHGDDEVDGETDEDDDDEDEDEATNASGAEDLDAAFEGRYHRHVEREEE